MGIFGNRVASRLGLVLSVAVLGALGPADLHSSAPSENEASSYVLVTTDTVRTAQLVQSVGGAVLNSSASVSTVGVELTIEQAELISRSSLIQRISETEVLESEKQQVASWWWR